MTQQANYTPEEWDALTEIPTLVGSAVMVAGESGADTLKEARALVKALFSGGTDHPENELVRAVVRSRVQELEKGTLEVAEAHLAAEPSAVLERAIAQAGFVRGVLEAKGDPAEAAEFKGWLLDIGQKVAEAAREGGLLKVIGLGGKLVSKNEQKALDAIRAALG